MNKKIYNNDIAHQVVNISEILIKLNDNNEALAVKVEELEDRCKELTADANRNNEAIQEAVCTELNSRDILDTTQVESVINDYDMEDKLTDALRHSDVVSSDNFGEEMRNHDVPDKDDVEGMIDERIDSSIRAMLHAHYIGAAKAVDSGLSEVREECIGNRAVREFKAKEAEKKKEETPKAGIKLNLPRLPSLPQPPTTI
tara:strand:+ start:1529 stop:2128 length:600 start_codon:yes stop_codon:yes gene_type:complete